LKQNDLIPPDYDDEEGQKEIDADELVTNKFDEMEFAASLQQQAPKKQIPLK
jgi:hypothetical protein